MQIYSSLLPSFCFMLFQLSLNIQWDFVDPYIPSHFPGIFFFALIVFRPLWQDNWIKGPVQVKPEQFVAVSL